jgi:hypothetical protein
MLNPSELNPSEFSRRGMNGLWKKKAKRASCVLIVGRNMDAIGVNR